MSNIFDSLKFVHSVISLVIFIYTLDNSLEFIQLNNIYNYTYSHLIGIHFNLKLLKIGLILLIKMVILYDLCSNLCYTEYIVSYSTFSLNMLSFKHNLIFISLIINLSAFQLFQTSH